MSVPQPPSPLAGQCSAIDNAILYVLTPTALQSIPLKEHATWSSKPPGVSVTRPACVRAVPNGDESQAALYVIGGSTDDLTYGGLQRYFFGNQSWESLPLLANVLQSRTNHSAVYLNDSSSILVYAGSQPQHPSTLSSQTFMISVLPPYNMQSFISHAPPTNQPILVPWNTSHALMAGGALWNAELYTFSPQDGWIELGTNLSKPLSPGTQGMLIDGSDGSKVLETYDCSTSPNTVAQTVVLGANGQTAPNGQTAGGGTSSRKRKRDLTTQNWPAYNSTDAPAITRSEYSLSQDLNGMAVIAGGSDNSPLAMFDQTGNTWVDASKFFNGASSQQPLLSSSPPGSSAAPTSASTSSTVAPKSSGSTSRSRMLRTLGITIGVLCGIAALFILILLFLRWRKMRQKRKHKDSIDEKGNRMSFADRGASFMKEAEGSAYNLVPPPTNRHPDANNSHSSIAIMAGKFGKKRNTNHARKNSYESTAPIVRDRSVNALSAGEVVEMETISEKNRRQAGSKPRARGEPMPGAAHAYGSSPDTETSREKKRSSGWSKYFAASEPNHLSHLPSAYRGEHNSDSQYTSSGVPSQLSRIPSSALVPPLDIDFSKAMDGQRLSHVQSGSPSFNNSSDDLAKRGSLAEGQTATVHNHDEIPESQTESISSMARSTASSGFTSDYYGGSGSTPWTPMSNTFKDHVNNRPVSSLYTASVYEQRIPSRGKSPGFFPGAGTNYRPPPKARRGHSTRASADWAAPKPAVPAKDNIEDRESTMTIFPRGVPSAYYANRDAQRDNVAASETKKAINSDDMSWLNLGLGGKI